MLEKIGQINSVVKHSGAKENKQHHPPPNERIYHTDELS